MENKKYICPQCGNIMREDYEKPALNLSCPKCNCKIATTRWEDIDLDVTIYEIISKPKNKIDVEKIKLISKLTGLNYFQSRDLLTKGGTILKCRATEVKSLITKLESKNIDYYLNPDFPW